MEYSKLGINKCYLINDFKIKTLIIKFLFTLDINKFTELTIKPDMLKESIKYKVAYLDEGNNYILFLKKINNIYYTLLIKKNFNYTYTDINFNNLEIYFLDITYKEKYYDGTIIEGRLYNNLEFNIYNILMINGKQVNSILCYLSTSITDEINELTNKYFRLKFINFVNLKDIIKKDCTGLLFIDINSKQKYIQLFNKNKNLDKKYAILYMQRLNTDIFNLFCLKDNHKYNIGIAHIPTIKLSHYFNKFENEITVKCWYNKYFSKWVPYELNEGKISSYTYIINSTKKI